MLEISVMAHAGEAHAAVGITSAVMIPQTIVATASILRQEQQKKAMAIFMR